MHGSLRPGFRKAVPKPEPNPGLSTQQPDDVRVWLGSLPCRNAALSQSLNCLADSVMVCLFLQDFLFIPSALCYLPPAAEQAAASYSVPLLYSMYFCNYADHDCFSSPEAMFSQMKETSYLYFQTKANVNLFTVWTDYLRRCTCSVTAENKFRISDLQSAH